METLRTISDVLGWGYMLSWSISFYPQILLNFKRKSCLGLSVDFVLLNILGFLCYTIYNASYLLIIPRYFPSAMDPSGSSLVKWNDFIFAVHALLICLISLGQVLWYAGQDRMTLNELAHQSSCIRQVNAESQGSADRVDVDTADDQPLLSTSTPPSGTRVYSRVNPLTWLFLALFVVGSIILSILFGCQVMELSSLLIYLASVKMFISLIKYAPQVWLNYSRKSTVGWSIWQILLDLAGGILSTIQLFLDAWIENISISGNLIKLGLGMQSIVFDGIFIWQHYVLYADSIEEHVSESVLL